MIGEGETITWAQATAAQRGRWPTCLRCRGHVDSIEVSPELQGRWNVVIRCHDATDIGAITKGDLVTMPAGHNPLALVEKWSYGYAFTEFACRVVYVRTRHSDVPSLSHAQAILVRTCIERAIDDVHAEGSRGFFDGEWRRVWKGKTDGDAIIVVTNRYLLDDAMLDLEVSAVCFGDQITREGARAYLAVESVEVRPRERTLVERRRVEAESAIAKAAERELAGMLYRPSLYRPSAGAFRFTYPSAITMMRERDREAADMLSTPPAFNGREILTPEGQRHFDDLVEKYAPSNPANSSHMADAAEHVLGRLGRLYDIPRRSGKRQLASQLAEREHERMAEDLRIRSEAAWSALGAILIVVSRAWASKPDLDDSDKRFALLEFT